MTVEIHDIAGIAGVTLILVTYLLLQIGRLHGTGLVYSSLNALGAALVIVSLWVDFNLSAFIVESFWIAISLYGIAKAIRTRRSSELPLAPTGDGTGTRVIDRKGPDQ